MEHLSACIAFLLLGYKFFPEFTLGGERTTVDHSKRFFLFFFCHGSPSLIVS